MKNAKSVYSLTAIHPEIHRDCRKGHYLKDEDGCFKCHNELIGVFSSEYEAHRVIKTLVEEKSTENKLYDYWDTYFGFILNEHFIDHPLYGGNFVSHFESCRSYISNGVQNCFSECDDRCTKKFFGTKYPNPHIKSGDIALVYCGSSIMPVLIEEKAMTEAQWEKRMKTGAYGDWTDDSGISFSSFNGHCHPFSPCLFPMSCLPYAVVPKKEIAKMKTCKKLYFEGKAL